MIFNVYSNCVHPRFWIRKVQVPHLDDFLKILKFLNKSTSWNQVLWSLVVSNIIPSHSWYPRKSPYVFWFIFKIIDCWWFLMDFWCSQVWRVLRIPSHPQDECPKLVLCSLMISAALRVSLAVTWLTVYRQLQIGKSEDPPASGGAPRKPIFSWR